MFHLARYSSIRPSDLEKALGITVGFDSIFDRLFDDYERNSNNIGFPPYNIRKEQDEKGFRKFWADYCDNVVYVRAQERWNTYENPIHPENNSPCLFLWERLLVCHDGTCNPCDEDYKTMLSPGNINEKSLAEIWQGSKMTKIREDHMMDRRNCHMPCDRCAV